MFCLFSRERNREDKKRDREEDEEEAYERRKLERKLREKEAAYQEVLFIHFIPQTGKYRESDRSLARRS